MEAVGGEMDAEGVNELWSVSSAKSPYLLYLLTQQEK